MSRWSQSSLSVLSILLHHSPDGPSFKSPTTSLKKKNEQNARSDKMSRMNIGIIGCGLIADTHVYGLKDAVPDADIYVSDTMPGKAQLMCKQHGLAGSYTDYHEMLNRKDLLAIHVLTPPRLHVDQAIDAIRAGCHVIIEKPAAFSVQEIRNVFQEARTHDKVVTVGHSLLCQPSVLKLFDCLRNEDDDVLFVKSFYGIESDNILSRESKVNSHWKFTIPGGPVMDSLVHPVSLLVEFTGDPKDINTRATMKQGRVDQADVSWEGNGVLASVSVSFSAKPFRRITEVVTNKRTLVVDHSMETLIVCNVGPGPRSVQKVYRNLSYSCQLAKGTLVTSTNVLRGRMKQNPGTRGIIKNFYEHLDSPGDKKCSVSEDNVIRTTEIIERLSGAAGSVVKGRNDPADQPVLSQRATGPLVLVTGASGFLGRSLCEKLPEIGCGVKAQVRRGQNADRISSPQVQKIYMDFRYDDADYDSLTKSVDVIVHAAHASGAKTLEQYRAVNVKGAIDLYEAGKRNGCELFIYISSVAVYGLRNRRRTASEADDIGSNARHWDFYARSKIEGEDGLLEKAGSGGPKLLILRPGILYSADGQRLTKRTIPLRDGKRLMVVIGNGRNFLPYTRVDAISDVICRIIKEKLGGETIYNLTGAQTEACAEFVRRRLGAKGIKCIAFRIPALPLRAVALLLEGVSRIAGKKSEPKLSRYVIDSSTRNMSYDNSKAIKDLAWDPQVAVKE